MLIKLIKFNVLYTSRFTSRKKMQYVRSIFIDAVSTPNPHSMKFIPGREVLPEQFGTGLYYQKGDQKQFQNSPLAKTLFKINGVKGIFLARDFITVTKQSDESWQVLKPHVFSQVLDFFSEDENVVVENNSAISDTSILDTDDEVVATIKELIETRVRPSVQEDGGDIFYEGFNPETGIVQVRLAGSCVGCPSSSITLRNGVEKMLTHYIPEVKGIEEVQKEENSAKEEDTIN